MFLSLDAITRSLSRRLVSGKHLLEWETAAQVEFGGSKNSLDVYLQLSPVLAFVIALLLAFTNIRLPVRGGSHPVALGNRAARRDLAQFASTPGRGPAHRSRQTLPAAAGASVWRYFHEFGDEKNHWLIPDNVEEKDMLQVRKLSPTNLGMLFNARQAAYEFGFLTLPEFARATLGTLATYERLEKQRGHIYNWYDIETLQPIPPFTISTVDSGNLTASLYTLHTGALDLLKRPLLEVETLAGLEQTLSGSTEDDSRDQWRRQLSNDSERSSDASSRALSSSSKRPRQLSPLQSRHDLSSASREIWLAHELSNRRSAMSIFVQNYAPWFLPQFEAIFALPQLNEAEDQQHPYLAAGRRICRRIGCENCRRHSLRCRRTPRSLPLLHRCDPCCSKPPSASTQLKRTSPRLPPRPSATPTPCTTASSSSSRASSSPSATTEPPDELHSACYDLLASEARIASFIAVAKGDIPQQSWFRLDRSHVMVNGHPALLSWTGTMFEYMMPALWMRTFPNTLISRSLESAVRIQRDHVRNIPWGISESGFAKMDPQGRYGYQAWGIPALALKYGAEDGPVISPYSTFLALSVLRKDAIANLRRMAAMNWMGAYGFYEAADYTQGKQPELVRSWMAHHQGMCLLALTNLLKNNIVQHWFHATPRVRAAELLLHEKPLSKETLKELSNRSKLQSTE